MAKMKDDDFGIELPRKRLVGCLGLLVGGFLFFLHYVFDRILLQPVYSGRARKTMDK